MEPPEHATEELDPTLRTNEPEPQSHAWPAHVVCWPLRQDCGVGCCGRDLARGFFFLMLIKQGVTVCPLLAGHGQARFERRAPLPAGSQGPGKEGSGCSGSMWFRV